MILIDGQPYTLTAALTWLRARYGATDGCVLSTLWATHEGYFYDEKYDELPMLGQSTTDAQ